MTQQTSGPGVAAARRARTGWILYDVANSAFVTTVVTALGGPYLTALAEAAAGPADRVDLLGWEPRAGSVYAYVTSASVVVQVLLLPLLGALADRARGKQRLLAAGTGTGVVATMVLALATGWQLAALALLVANVAFGAAIVAYNAFLADVAPPDERDKVSSQGFAAGYLGGAVLLALALVALKVGPGVGLSTGTVVRGSVVAAGLWWGAFGVVALRRLSHVGRQWGGGDPLPHSFPRQVRTSVRDLRDVAGELRRLPLTARFLGAFLLFNDAIQAVVALSSVFLTQELYVAKGRDAEDATSFLLALILMIQVVAVLGALGFARLANRVGTKRALLVSLAGWVGVVVYAYLALQTTGQAWALGAVIALVLGGSQALARSLFSLMVPDGRQAAFFGIYELAERGTAWIGTLVFAVVVDVTGSYRLAILSLLVLLVSGSLLLMATDTDAAIRAARAEGYQAPGSPTYRGGLGRPAADRTYRVLLRLLRVVLGACTRTGRRGLGHIPARGPVLVVGNHLSVADGFVLVDTVARAGRRVRMMGTAGLFRAPVVGAVLRTLGFIPVFRRSSDPASALGPAAEALGGGECVGLYPEGRITTDPAHRPGRGRTGVVRLALDCEAPVVPVVQWGTQHVVAEGTTGSRLRRAALLPLRRPPVEVIVGTPLDLRAALGVRSAAEASPELLRVGADLVMAAISAQVEVLAGRGAAGTPSRLGDRAGHHLALGVDGVPG
ncbi:MAG: MFS transporter, partial [Actinomycetes bacterium]